MITSEAPLYIDHHSLFQKGWIKMRFPTEILGLHKCKKTPNSLILNHSLILFPFNSRELLPTAYILSRKSRDSSRQQARWAAAWSRKLPTPPRRRWSMVLICNSTALTSTSSPNSNALAETKGFSWNFTRLWVHTVYKSQLLWNWRADSWNILLSYKICITM